MEALSLHHEEMAPQSDPAPMFGGHGWGLLSLGTTVGESPWCHRGGSYLRVPVCPRPLSGPLLARCTPIGGLDRCPAARSSLATTVKCTRGRVELWLLVDPHGFATSGRVRMETAQPLPEGGDDDDAERRMPVASSRVTYSVSRKTPSSKASRTLSRAPGATHRERTTLATADCCESTPTRHDLARPAEKIIEGAVIDARRSARPSGFVRLHARARAL